MYYCGVDPGMGGALAVLDDTGALVAVQDMPVLTLRTSRGMKLEYDCPALVQLLAPYAGSQSHVYIEEAQSMPGQGVRSMFTIGVGFGLWLGVLAALALPYTRVRPHVWKKSMGLEKDKEASRLRAQQCFPTADLRRKKDHGRSEALLIALYGRRIHSGAREVS